MTADGRSVYKHFRLIVTSSDMEYSASALALPAFGQSDGLFIPYSFHKVCMSNSRKLTFGAERNGDLRVKMLFCLKLSLSAGSAVVDLKFPFAVEIYPFISDKLRAGVF